jgi:hypothetical protein
MKTEELLDRLENLIKAIHRNEQSDRTEDYTAVIDAKVALRWVIEDLLKQAADGRDDGVA